MALKELIFGHKKYCVRANSKAASCLDRCFPTAAEAKAYKKKVCGCYIQTIKQRRPFTKDEPEGGEPPEPEPPEND